LIKRKPGFSGKMFWTLEIPFKTGFTVLSVLAITQYEELNVYNLLEASVIIIFL
jgi:hypothetical protein